MPFGDGLRDQDVDRDAVLGVHADEAADLAGALHGPEDLAVVDHEHARVGHEQLERGDPLVDRLLHLGRGAFIHVGHDEVKAVVDGRYPFGLRVPGVEPGAERLPLLLHGEIDDRRRAAVRGRQGPRLEVVARARAPERHVHVGVGVDAAGEDVLPARVDGHVERSGRREAGGKDRDDGLAFNGHVCGVRIDGSDYRAALDECSGHGLKSYAILSTSYSTSEPPSMSACATAASSSTVT